jgi:hypothetical protein
MPAFAGMTNKIRLLLNNLRHKVQSGFSLGRNLLEVFAIIRLGHLVRPQTLGGFKRMGQWLHAARIDTVQLLHKGQNIRQITGVPRDVTGIDSQSSQVGNLLNICGIKRHGHSVSVIPAKNRGATVAQSCWQAHLHVHPCGEQATTLFS